MLRVTYVTDSIPQYRIRIEPLAILQYQCSNDPSAIQQKR